MSLKQGYLTKEGGNYKSWRKRWFILGNYTLSYYKSEHKNKVLGVIQLKEISGIRIFNQKKKKKIQTIMEVSTPRRNYYMVADTKDEVDEWRSAIVAQAEIAQGRRRNEAVQEEVVKVGKDDFIMLAIIGEGTFGKVVQVRMKESGDIYAMKVLNKNHIIETGEINHTIAERNILMRIDHPFIMGLHYSFQDTEKLYLVMDYVNGGELFFHLQQEKKFPYERARFYTAEIVLALEHLHNNAIIYRDLKPENILLDSDGHIKITDFGLSKEGFGDYAKTKTFCGTPEYLAPEIINGMEYSKAVDWWSVGTLLFEMLTGMPPFYDPDVQRMYTNKMTADPMLPEYIQDPCREFILRLLDKNSETRLQDSNLIKTHPYFQGIEWEALLRKDIPPPFIPDVKSKESTAYIDKQFTSKNVVLEITSSAGTHSSGTITPSSEGFAGFTYVGTRRESL